MAEEKKLILPFDDGAEVIDELEDEFKEHEEEVKDALEDAIETVEEINGDEHIEAIPEELKLIKNEKLILKEPSDILDEALPKDLVKIYKKRNNRVGDSATTYGRIDWNYGHPDYDFQNSEYTEITPEEAKELKKQGRAPELRVIFDGQLITFNKNGWSQTGNYAALRHYNSDISKYTKNRSGKIVDKSNALSFDEVIKGADKIYIADEKNIDQDLINQRQTNPESKYYNTGIYNNDLLGNYHDHGSGFNSYDNNRIIRLKNEIKSYEKRLADSTNLDVYERDHILNVIQNNKKELARYELKRKDANAVKRNYASQLDLRQTSDKFKSLKKDAISAQNSLQKAKNNYDNIKNNGTYDARYYKGEIERLNNRLSELMRNIARYELYLQDEDDKSSAELDKAMADINDYQAKIDNVQAELNKLLRRD